MSDADQPSEPQRLDRHEHRLTELEIEAAFRRAASDDLDEVVREQGRRIDALERRIAELLERSRDEPTRDELP
jgi:uncharacterized coiled-coil protein SlyX